MEAIMRRTTRILALAAVFAAVLATASSAFASKTVCASGCPYTGINAAIAGLPPHSYITIGAGEYVEEVKVNKEDTLQGSGLSTVVRPATSNPECSPGSLCEGAASNIVLVEASNVTISKMLLNGSNPSLSGGVEVGGVKVDARNGVIVNFNAGSFTNLTVTKTKVENVYLRGIYNSDEGSFSFTRDTVENVQGSDESIAMFNFGGTGVFERNKVTKASDAISSNWSRGTKYLDNKVTASGSGVHTDNNGGSGGEADTIEDNKVTACTSEGYGIFVFAPYVSATVAHNTVKGCAVGYAAFGSQVSGQGPKFSDDIANGAGAATSEPAGTVGMYLTTDLLGYGYGDLTASITGSIFENYATGMLVTQTKPTPGQPAGGQATVTASPEDQFVKDTTGAYGEAGTIVNARDDWWGCPQGPNNPPPCTSALGTVEYTPWLTSRP
jgi:hypothetical protein